MRKLHLAILFAAGAIARADVITQWDFNSPFFDSDPATGQFEPASGTGFAEAVSVTAEFSSVAGGQTSDGNSGDNTQLRLASFPAQGTLNKGAGIKIFASTAGYENIRLTWDHYNSGSASRYWRVQYTVDGFTWLDHEVMTSTRASAWQLDRSVSFQGLPGVDHNPSFGLRLVSEFESSAVGGGLDEYLPVSGENYSRAGTVWLDMVTLHGDPIWDGNTPPGMSLIADQVTRVNTPTAPIGFTIHDAETALDGLLLAYEVSPAEMISEAEFGGSGSERSFVLTPAPDQVGSAVLTLRVTDEQGRFTERSFALSILPVNTPPFVSNIPEQQVIRGGTLGPIPFSLGDLESDPDELIFKAESSNPGVIPPEGILILASAADASITISPHPVRVGSSTITLTVSDGELEGSMAFSVQVLPASFITVWNFNSRSPDDDANTGALEPSVGEGLLSLIGIVTNSFGRIGTGGTSDPAESDNSMLRVGGFPAQGSGNKKCGLELRVSTSGRKNIALMWDHYNSNTASRYWRLQYSTNGIDFIDHNVFTNTVPVTWQKKRVIGFSDLAGVNDNPEFRVRFVSELESTATGAGEDRYLAVNEGSNYSVAGTLWIDQLALAGDSLEEAVLPALSIRHSGGQLEISWPAGAGELQLESTSSLSNPEWRHPSESPVLLNDLLQVVVPVSEAQRFFRLKMVQ